jgi:hypothetical protein
VSRSPNKLLASLSRGEFRRIAPRLHTLRLSNGSTLPHCGTARVYFPGTGVSSILSRMNDGTTIEVASVGSEGIVGVPALGSQLGIGSYLQVAHGTVQYMSLNVFEALCAGSELGRAVDQFCGLFMQSVMQLVACNRFHDIDARCARWLLLAHERVGRANFELTQPFLAMAIGAKADELTAVMVPFTGQNIVRYDAATVTVIDAIALRRLACPCYSVLCKHSATPARVRSTGGHTTTANVVQMRPATVCTLCGLTRDYPHKSHAECLRAIDTELRSLIGRARTLTKQRAQLVAESMQRFERFRRPS